MPELRKEGKSKKMTSFRNAVTWEHNHVISLQLPPPIAIWERRLPKASFVLTKMS
jgi:hypothetical protein